MPEIFSPEINWLSPLIEEHEHETAIFIAYDGSEQRQSLMDIPHRRLTYSISALDHREAARLEALIRKVQGELCYVPYWRGTSYLNSPPAFSPGAKTRLYFDGDPTKLGFEVGEYAMVWKSPHEAFVSQVYWIFSDGILTEVDLWQDPGPWPARLTKVTPAFLGQLAPETDLDYAAKFAKTTQVTFDLLSHQTEISADCNWAFLEAVLNPLHMTWVIDPTGGPDGGPALKGTVPPNSRDVHLVDFPATAYITISGLRESDVIHTYPYHLEVKVKTDWDIDAVTDLDGVPGIALAPGVGRVTGTHFEPATGAAFNNWQQLSTVLTAVGDGGVASVDLVMSLGTSDTVAHTAMWADVVVKDDAGNVIHTCLPSVPSGEPEMTPIFTPLECLHRPGSSMQKVTRMVDQLSSPAGVFSVRPHADDPLTTHALDLVFFNAEEWYAFRAFHDLVLGAFGAFWVPSYQQDLTPVGVIGAADVDIIIEDIDYTALDFPSLNRRQIAFVQPNGSFVKRSITNAVNNGDGTETITINEALGFTFQQNNANGICFLWYGRFVDDVSHMEWVNSEHGTMSIAMVELRDPPDGGSGDSSFGFLFDVAP